MSQLIQKSRAGIEKICKEEGIQSLALFGSYARGDEKKDSDIDLLVEFKEVPGLIQFIQVKTRFEQLFRRKVDFVTKNSVSKYIKPYIQKDLQQVYG